MSQPPHKRQRIQSAINNSSDSSGDTSRGGQSDNDHDLRDQMSLLNTPLIPQRLDYIEAPPARDLTGTTSAPNRYLSPQLPSTQTPTQSIQRARDDARAHDGGSQERGTYNGLTKDPMSRPTFHPVHVERMMLLLSECKNEGMFNSTKAKEWQAAFESTAASMNTLYPEMTYTALSIKNKFESERYRYRMWLSFTNMPGVYYDEATGHIMASDEQWEAFLYRYRNSRICERARKAPLGVVSIYRNVFFDECLTGEGKKKRTVDELTTTLDDRNPPQTPVASSVREAAAERRSVPTNVRPAAKKSAGAVSDVVTASANIRSAFAVRPGDESIRKAIMDFNLNFAAFARAYKGEMGVTVCIEKLSLHPMDVAWNATPTELTKKAFIMRWLKDVEAVDFDAIMPR